MDTQTHRPTDIHADIQADIQTEIDKIERQTDRQRPNDYFQTSYGLRPSCSKCDHSVPFGSLGFVREVLGGSIQCENGSSICVRSCKMFFRLFLLFDLCHHER